MFRQLGIGACFALTAAAIAVGCNSSKGSSFIANSGEVNDPNNAMGALQQVDQSDHAAFSDNNQTASGFGSFQVKFNQKRPDSDGVAGAADNSAMVVFSTGDNGTGTRGHFMAAQWSGQSFAGPQELTAPDQDDTLTTSDTRFTHVSSVVLLPINGAPLTAAAGGGSNSPFNGDWIILWDSETVSHTPALDIPDTDLDSLAAVDANGPHKQLVMTIFHAANRNQPDSVTALIGNTATSGAANGPATELKFGFQVVGARVNTEQGGASAGNFDGGAPAVAGFTGRPASDVISYGVASDTLQHCASFGSTVADPTGLNNVGHPIGTVGATVLGPTVNSSMTVGGATTVSYTGLLVGAAQPAAASYTVGDNTTFVQIFWTQLVTSHAGANTTTFNAGNGSFAATVQLGPEYEFWTGNLNLAEGVVQNQAKVAFTTTTNSFTDGRSSSTQALPGFKTYNNLVFWNYADTSLAVSVTQGSAGDTQIQSYQQAMAILPVTTGLNGTASINQAGQIDVTMLGSAGKHSTVVTTTIASIAGTETVAFNPCGGCSIIGPDEGCADVTAFVLGTISTNTVANADNSQETELWATAVTTAGVPVAGTNPRAVSKHAATPLSTTVDYTVRDNIADAKVQIDRDGTYVLCGYRQAQGTTIQENMGLMAQVYRTFRSTATVGSSSTPVTAPTMDERFPTAAPVQVNTPANTAYTGQSGTLPGLWTGSPVVAYDFQGHIGYKCGFQGDVTKMSILWAHADGSQDRAFIRQAVVVVGATVTTNPTLTFTAAESEFETANLTPSVAQLDLVTGGIVRSTFTFVTGTFGTVGANGGIPTPGSDLADTNFHFGLLSSCSSFLGNGADACDAGFEAGGAGGDVLTVFQKNVDNTVSDGNYFNQQVIATLYNGTALTDRAVISKNVNENSPTAAGFRTGLSALVPVTGNASLNPVGHTPDGGIYIYMTCPNDSNFTSPAGLYARHFKARVATSSPPTFANNFFPVASAAVTDPTFVNPVRLDRDLDSSVTFGQVLTQGRKAAVLFTQGNHIYLSITNDGESYSATGGLPTPLLVDNNTSANQNSNTNTPISFTVGQKSDSNCGNLSGSLCAFRKDDLDQNIRFYIRAFN
jgi:hypothetical protein